MALNPGSILENRYRLDRMLGQGGMGAVYRAWDMRLEQWVALKENNLTTPDAQTQFEQEAKVLARLRHSNLPRVIDHFITAQGVQYLVMDFVEGMNLAEMLRSRGRLMPEEVMQWLSQICDALNYLHTQNPPIIHRDIKPQNIRMTPDGRAVLVDFGLSKVGSQQQRTATGALGVTPGFSPPEQYGAAHTDQRSDIYSLAATLYALFTGETPPDSIQRAIANMVLKSPREMNIAISPALEAALVHGLETQPGRRPASIVAFQQEIEGALRSVNTNLAPPTVIAGRRPDSKPRSTGPAGGRISTPRPQTAPRPARGFPVWGWFALGGGAVVLLLIVALSMASGGRSTAKPTVVAIATATLAPVPATPAVAENTVNPPVAGATVTPLGSRTDQGQTTNLPTATPIIVIVTATSLPTSPPLPTATTPPRPSVTPTDTSVPATPTRRPTSRPANVATTPILQSPVDGYTLWPRDSENFQWKWTGRALSSNEGFELRMWKANNPDHPGVAPPVPYVANPNHVYTLYVGSIRATPGVQEIPTDDWIDVYWTVAVVQLEPYQRTGQEAKPFWIHT